MMSCREICKFAEMLAMTKREVLLSVMRLVDNINMKRIKRLLEIAITLIRFECHGRFDFRVSRAELHVGTRGQDKER